MIYLYDVSAMLYSGSFARRSKNWNQMFFPTGGLYKVFSYIFKDLKRLKEGDKIIVCFEGKGNIRKDEFPIYKSTRATKKTPLEREIIVVQEQALKEFLPKMGIPILLHDGLEADDMIYSVVTQNPTEQIIIRGDDADLYDTILINNNVKMESVAGRDIVPIRGTALQKVCHGDGSDDIPGLSKIWYKEAVSAAYKGKILNINQQGTLEELVKRLIGMGMPKEMVPEVARNIFLVQPKIIELDEIPQPKWDKKETSIILNILGFKSFLKRELGEERDYYSNKVKDGLVRLLSTTSEELKDHFLQIRSKEDKTYLDRNPEVDLGDRKIKSKESDLDKALLWTSGAMDKPRASTSDERGLKHNY